MGFEPGSDRTRRDRRTRIDDRLGKHERRFRGARGVPVAQSVAGGSVAGCGPGDAAVAPPGVVHAPGGAFAAGIPGDPRGRRHARIVLRPRTRLRDHDAAGTPAQGRCRNPVLRHRGSAQGCGNRSRHRRRNRTGRRQPGAHRCRCRRPSASRSRGSGRGRSRRDAADQGTGHHSADRFRRSPLHARVLPGRRRPEPQPRAHQGAHALRSGRPGTRCSGA